MGAVVKLSPELKTWIVNNLDRGCAPDQLVQSMIGEKFEPAIARGLIEAFAQARKSGRPILSDTLTLESGPPPYVYDTPRLKPGNTIETFDRRISVTVRMQRPVVAVLQDVLSAEECDQLIELARPRLTPSTVVDPVSGIDTVAEHRNSEGMFFRLEETPFISRLDQRISQLMNSPLRHGEGLQVLRYGPGTQSTPHFDFLIPNNLTNQQSLARSGQRVASLVIYLNDVPEGGATFFPELALSVCARKGHAVYFEYCNSGNQLDHLTLHAGAPVIAGEKWAVTKWMRQRPFVSSEAWRRRTG
jgi:prolyl 4-hydroxylase